MQVGKTGLRIYSGNETEKLMNETLSFGIQNTKPEMQEGLVSRATSTANTTDPDVLNKNSVTIMQEKGIIELIIEFLSNMFANAVVR